MTPGDRRVIAAVSVVHTELQAQGLLPRSVNYHRGISLTPWLFPRYGLGVKCLGLSSWSRCDAACAAVGSAITRGCDPAGSSGSTLRQMPF